VCQSGVYSAVFTVERELPEAKPIKKVIALDPNHKNLAYGVGTDGRAIEIESPWWLKKYDKRIDELKSKRDRCQKRSRLVAVLDDDGNETGKQRWEPSKRWKKLDATLQRALAKRRDQTKTFLYTVANGLMREYDMVAIGDYTPQGGGITIAMRRAMNNRSLIGRFKQIVSWCAAKSGKFYCEYTEEGTKRTCHKTGYRVEGGIPPSVSTPLRGFGVVQAAAACIFAMKTRRSMDSSGFLKSGKEKTGNYPCQCLARASFPYGNDGPGVFVLVKGYALRGGWTAVRPQSPGNQTEDVVILDPCMLNL